ncbi:MAG: FadR/GntR family transcriptional regulator [Woeseiaceae bacterium]
MAKACLDNQRNRKDDLAFTITDFRPTRGRTLSSQIVSHIRGALFSGELCPGDFLGSEADLSKQFGVSRMSVRDALRSLEAMGIVDIRMGSKGGATISEGSSDRFADALAIQLVLIGVSRDDVMQARVGIEQMAARLAARNATAADVRQLRALLDDAKRNLDDPEATSRLGEEFHMAVASASGNAVLVSQLQAFRDVLWAPGVRPDENLAKKIYDAHDRVLELIEARDEERAAASMAQHVSLIRKERQAQVSGD